MRTKSLAILAADGLQRKGQQNLFAHRVFQQYALALIVTDFSFRAGNGKLGAPCIGAQGPVQQIKTVDYLLDNGFKTAGTDHFNSCAELASKPYILYYLSLTVMLFDQLGTSGGVQIIHLPQVRPKIYRPRNVLLLEINGMEFQLMNFNQHRKPPHPLPDAAKDAEARTEA